MQSDCEMPGLDNVIDVLGLKLLFSLDPYFSTFKKKIWWSHLFQLFVMCTMIFYTSKVNIMDDLLTHNRYRNV